ncbi:MAG: protein tyrosine phosphatase family protein [SAR324 cluster bacterium]|nr:protein tyrosine phosphatase family protein [SAR324 cluster bacterium]
MLKPNPLKFINVLAIFIVIVTCSLKAAAQTSIDSLPIRNLSHPEGNTFASGQPTKEEFSSLAELGIKHIINLRPAEEQSWNEGEYVEALGMKYHSIPVAGAAGITKENALLFAATLKEIGGAPTLVHCASGNRIGALIALRQGLLEGKDIETAVNHGKLWGLTRLEPLVREMLSKSLLRPL